MAGYKYILIILFLCLCFHNANAESDILNGSELIIDFLLNDTSSFQTIDWTEYDTEWSDVMNNNINLPDDVDFISFPGKPIQSVYLHPVQKYVLYNETMYSDTIKPVPISGYKTGFSLFDSFTRSDIVDQNNVLSCTFTCVWTRNEIVNEIIKKTKMVKSINVFTVYFNTTLWGNLTNVNDLNLTLTNESKKCLILNFSVPDSATAYTINATSKNHTGYYEKYEYLYALNTSESLYYYDMDYSDKMSCRGIVPYGSNCFYLPYHEDYNISINIFTPFENRIYNYSNINIVTNEEKEYGDVDKEYIGFCFGFILGIYYLSRCI